MCRTRARRRDRPVWLALVLGLVPGLSPRLAPGLLHALEPLAPAGTVSLAGGQVLAQGAGKGVVGRWSIDEEPGVPLGVVLRVALDDGERVVAVPIAGQARPGTLETSFTLYSPLERGGSTRLEWVPYQEGRLELLLDAAHAEGTTGRITLLVEEGQTLDPPESDELRLAGLGPDRARPLRARLWPEPAVPAPASPAAPAGREPGFRELIEGSPYLQSLLRQSFAGRWQGRLSILGHEFPIRLAIEDRSGVFHLVEAEGPRVMGDPRGVLEPLGVSALKRSIRAVEPGPGGRDVVVYVTWSLSLASERVRLDERAALDGFRWDGPAFPVYELEREAP